MIQEMLNSLMLAIGCSVGGLLTVKFVIGRLVK